MTEFWYSGDRKLRAAVRSGIAGGLLVATALSSSAYGQDATVAVTGGLVGDEGYDEIVVTAQKREQSLNDVGISITAFSGEQLARQGVVQSTDIIAMTPGLSSGGNTGGQFQQFSIRGVTQNDVSDIVEPPNAVYIDEAYFPAAQTQVFGVLDIERVEVLRGPQGTLFGRNATGGLIHYITRKPTDTLDGFADLTYGSYNQVRIEAAIGGPIAQDLSVRVAGLFNRHDNILNNLYPSGNGGFPGSARGATDFWNDNQWNFRGQVRYNPGELDVLVSGFYAGSKISSAPYQSIASTAVVDAQGRQVNSIFSKNDPLGCVTLLNTGGCAAGGLRPVRGGDYFGYIDPDGSGLNTSSDFAGERLNSLKAYGSTGHISYDFGDISVTSISHYVYSDKALVLDVDASPIPVATLASGPTKTESFTQELRLNGVTGPLTWVGGVYFMSNKVNYQVAFSPGAAINGGVDAIAQSNLRTKSYSGFAQGEYALSDQFTLILGGRLIHDDQSFDYRAPVTINTDDATIDFGTILVPNARPPYADKRGQTLWAGRAQFNYTPNSDVLAYVSFNRGAKAGSYNSQANDPNPNLPTSLIPFGDETLNAYEIGLKLTLARGFQINASAFYYDYQDYQAFSYTPGSVSGVTTNLNAKSKGFEVETQMRPLENLFLTGSVGYIDAKVKDVGIATGILVDRTPAFTPKWKLAGSARYEIPDALLGGDLGFGVNASYQSKSFYNLQNFDSQVLRSFTLVNLRMSWTLREAGLEIAGFVNNIGDVRNPIQGFDLSTLCGCNEIAYGKPRWYGISLRKALR